MRVKRHGAFIWTLCILLTICNILCINTSAEQAQHWYCKRNADHKQPILDSELSWISEYRGVWVDQSHGDQNQDKVVYLTFDAGYENGNVEKILDVLDEQEVKGAFFILTNLIKRNPELVKRMANEGHLVCNHTDTHKNITKLSASETQKQITTLEQAYTELTGKQMAKYFRPPEGTFDKASLKTVCELGYTTVFWSFAYADWDNAKQMSAESAKQKILSNLHNGEILLLHPTSAANAQILGEVISEMKAQGYRFGTLDELCVEAP